MIPWKPVCPTGHLLMSRGTSSLWNAPELKIKVQTFLSFTNLQNGCSLLSPFHFLFFLASESAQSAVSAWSTLLLISTWLNSTLSVGLSPDIFFLCIIIRFPCNWPLASCILTTALCTCLMARFPVWDHRHLYPCHFD